MTGGSWAIVWCLLLVGACDCGEAADMCLTDEDCIAQSCVDQRCVSFPDASADTSGGIQDTSFPDQGFPDVPPVDVPPSMDATPCVDLSLEFSGEPTALEIPASARFLVVKAWGAGANGDGGVAGGPGGYTSAVYRVIEPQTLTVVVGQLGRQDGETAFGFAARGGGGLTGLFTGVPPLSGTEQGRAILIAGGGGSTVRNGGAAGGAGNSGGGMPSMTGGNATFTGPAGANVNTGGGGGYEGGLGRQSSSTPGLGGTGIVVSEAGGLELRGASILEASSNRAPPYQDDEDYPVLPCPPGSQECSGYIVVRVLCEEPPPLI